MRHTILGGKVHLYKRPDARCWMCSTSIGGVQYRASSKKEDLAQAEDAAEEWYLELRGKYKRDELDELVQVNRERTFAEAAQQFLHEFPILTEGQRNPVYVQNHERRVNRHLLPFMGDMPLSQVTSRVVQEYRIHRIEKSKAEWGKLPARGTIHQEIVALRQILKTALRYQWINSLPDLSQPYKTSGKLSHRAWFSPEEYRTLYTETQRLAKDSAHRFAWEYAQLHDRILFMANTGLRPDEAARLEYRDVSIVDDDASGETILEIECRGKRGYGPCKSTANAVPVFRRLLERNQPQPTDRLFPTNQRDLLNRILVRLDLRRDREGQLRTFYSLRHTYISFRLMEGANIVQLAWNCRTSVDMIEKYYASHIKTRLDASAINVRRKQQAHKENAKREELRSMLREVISEELAKRSADNDNQGDGDTSKAA